MPTANLVYARSDVILNRRLLCMKIIWRSFILINLATYVATLDGDLDCEGLYICMLLNNGLYIHDMIMIQQL